MNATRFEQLSNLTLENLLPTITLSEAQQLASMSMEQLITFNHNYNKCQHLQRVAFEITQLHDQLCVVQAYHGTDPTAMEVICGLLFNNFNIPHSEGRLILLAYFGVWTNRPVQLAMDTRGRLANFAGNSRMVNTNVITRLHNAAGLQIQYGYAEPQSICPESLNRLVDGANKFFNEKDMSKTVTIGEFRAYNQILENSNGMLPQSIHCIQPLMNRVELMDHLNHLMASLTGMSSGSDNPQVVVYEHMLKLAKSYFEGCDEATYLAVLTTTCFGETLLSSAHLNITDTLIKRTQMIVPNNHPYYNQVMGLLATQTTTQPWNRFGSTSAGSNVHLLNLPQEVEKAFREYNSGEMDVLIGYLTRGLMSNIIASTGHGPLSVPRGFAPDDVYRFGAIISKAELIIRKIETNLGANPNEINHFTPVISDLAESLSRLLDVRILDNIKPLTKALLFGMKSNVKTVLTLPQLNKLDELLETLELETAHLMAVRESYGIEVKPTKADDDMMEILIKARAEAALDRAMVDGLINLSHDAAPSKIKEFWLDLLLTPVDQLKGKYPTALFDAVHNAARRMAGEEHGYYQGALELLTALHELRIESVKEPEEEINSLNNIILRARDNATEILKEESPWILEVDELTEEQITQVKALCKNPLYTLALATLPIKTWEEETLYEGEDTDVGGLGDRHQATMADSIYVLPSTLSVEECVGIVESVVKSLDKIGTEPNNQGESFSILLKNYFVESGTELINLFSSLALIYSGVDDTLGVKNGIKEAYGFCVENGPQEINISYLPEVNIGRLLFDALNK